MASYCTIFCQKCEDASALESCHIEQLVNEGWDALHSTVKAVLTCCGQQKMILDGPKRLMTKLRTTCTSPTT